MPIVFGYGHFNLRTINPVEIGIIDNAAAGIKFQLKQKYGHIFWIPFIPLGQKWTINKGDGKMYVCPPDLAYQLENRFPGKTSPYAFSGLILIVLGIVIFSISEKIDSYQSKKRYETSFAADAQNLISGISDIRAGQFLLFNARKGSDGYYDWNKIPMKVMHVNGEQVQLGSYSTDVASAKFASENEEIIKTDLENNIIDSFVISKEALKKAVVPEANANKNFAGVAVREFSADAVFKLTDIRNLQGPLLSENLQAAGKSKQYFEIVNKGYPVVADSIIGKTTGVNWQLSKKHYLGNNENIAVKTDGKGQATLFCSDADKNVFRFEVNNESYSVNIKAL